MIHLEEKHVIVRVPAAVRIQSISIDEEDRAFDQFFDAASGTVRIPFEPDSSNVYPVRVCVYWHIGGEAYRTSAQLGGVDDVVAEIEETVGPL